MLVYLLFQVVIKERGFSSAEPLFFLTIKPKIDPDKFRVKQLSIWFEFGMLIL
jgi:hypothetical protein